jgi:outer membrane protein assembly factor BamB
MKYLFCIITLVIMFPFTSCKKSTPGGGGGGVVLSANKSITSFVFKAADNAGLTADINGVISADSVVITVPYGTNITALKPTVQHNAVLVTPASGAVQNFNSPVTYIVKAEDGSTKNYLAVVKIHITSTVYAGSADGKLYALDGDNGTVKWTYFTAGTINEACPTYYNGTVFIGSTDGFMHAIDAVTGILKWKYSTGSNLGGSTPTLNAGILYFGTSTTGSPRYLIAVNATTGVKIWDRVHPNAFVHPTWYNNIVYGGGLYGLDGFNAGDGTTAVHFTNSITPGNPLLVNNVVYAGNEATVVTAYNASTGALKWFYGDSPGPNASLFSPTLYKGTVYNTGNSNNLYALDSATGALKWKYTSGPNSVALGSPVVANDIVYTVNANGRFYAVDALTGNQRWIFDDGITGSSMPYYNCNGKGDMVYFGNHTKKIYALNAFTGALVWQYTTGGLISGGACIVAQDGSVYHPGISGEHQ